MPIAVHVLTLPSDNPEWLNLLADDLSAHPVYVLWRPGIKGKTGEARYKAFSECAHYQFCSFADPDDRITPGVFSALSDALKNHPSAPYAYTGEQKINGSGKVLAPPEMPAQYDIETHRKKPSYVHGVILFRTQHVLSVAEIIRGIDRGSIWALTLKLSEIYGDPVPLQIVGRLWRQHARQSSRRFSPADKRTILGGLI